MRYPCLVPKHLCKTDICLELEKEGLDEYGEPLPVIVFEGKCNYQDGGKSIFTADKKLVQLSGVALFPGDICPEFPLISGGVATVMGTTRRIFSGRKARNPDGSVNYTEVQLI